MGREQRRRSAIEGIQGCAGARVDLQQPPTGVVYEEVRAGEAAQSRRLGEAGDRIGDGGEHVGRNG